MRALVTAHQVTRNQWSAAYYTLRARERRGSRVYQMMWCKIEQLGVAFPEQLKTYAVQPPVKVARHVSFNLHFSCSKQVQREQLYVYAMGTIVSSAIML